LQKTSGKLRTTLVAKVLEQKKFELDDLSIKYEESAITYMKQLTQPNKAVLMFAPGQSTTLTAAKIHQMLSCTKHIILNLQQLLPYKSEVMFAWKSRFDVLVVESQRSIENLQDVCNEMSEILNECVGEKRFIFIADTEGNIEQINAFRHTFSKKLREEYNDRHLRDVSTESRKFSWKRKLLSKVRKYQSRI
jgi:peroxiredoxin